LELLPLPDNVTVLSASISMHADWRSSGFVVS
jgi:hypothetical protein